MKTRFNKILSVLLVLIMLVSAVPLTVSAATSGMCGDNLYWSFDEATGELTISGEGEMIEDVYYTCPWQDYKQDIKSVVIEDGVTCIDAVAFYYYRSLSSVTIGNSVTRIKPSAFEGCSSLINITISDSVTHIDEDVFAGTGYYNDNLNWENSVLYIGNHLIDAKDTVSGSFKIKNGTKCIAESAFYNCDNLTSLYVPGSVTSIGWLGCENLADVYYDGTEEKWKNVEKSGGNNSVFNADIHFLTEEDVELNVTQLSKDGNIITAAIDLTSGTFNSIDLAFEMNGLVCRSIEKGAFAEESGVLFASNPASNAKNNIAIASFDGITPGNLAVVTLEVIDDSYSFNVKATDCEAVGDENVKVEPIITSSVSGFEHRYSSVVTDPTCEDEGYITYTCPCGETYVDDYVDPLGHDMGGWEEITPATCTETGEETRGCSRCEYTETREIPVIPHSHKAVVTPPTCTEQGYTTYTCSCGDTYIDSYVAKAGHTPGEWVVTVLATSLTDGTKVLKCSVCTTVLDTQSISRFGSVNSVSIDNLSMQYKTSLALTPVITVDSGVEYTVSYSSSDPSVATVDENGNVYAAGKGTAEITCTVTDEYGNVASDTATVEVKYVWWQWIIVILLFGWIWY